MRFNTKVRVLEFVVAGIIVDLIENSIVFQVTAGRSLAWKEAGIAVLVIIPFAILTELVIDHPRFWHRLFGRRGHKFDDVELRDDV